MDLAAVMKGPQAAEEGTQGEVREAAEGFEAARVSGPQRRSDAPRALMDRGLQSGEGVCIPLPCRRALGGWALVALQVGHFPPFALI